MRYYLISWKIYLINIHEVCACGERLPCDQHCPMINKRKPVIS